MKLNVSRVWKPDETLALDFCKTGIMSAMELADEIDSVHFRYVTNKSDGAIIQFVLIK